jgi:serine/threonine protein phosphatase PrpC
MARRPSSTQHLIVRAVCLMGLVHNSWGFAISGIAAGKLHHGQVIVHVARRHRTLVPMAVLPILEDIRGANDFDSHQTYALGEAEKAARAAVAASLEEFKTQRSSLAFAQSRPVHSAGADALLEAEAAARAVVAGLVAAEEAAAEKASAVAKKSAIKALTEAGKDKELPTEADKIGGSVAATDLKREMMRDLQKRAEEIRINRKEQGTTILRLDAMLEAKDSRTLQTTPQTLAPVPDLPVRLRSQPAISSAAVSAISSLPGRANQDGAFISALPTSGIHIFGVFDGHGLVGEEVVEWLQAQIITALDAELGTCSDCNLADKTDAIAKVFAGLDAQLYTSFHELLLGDSVETSGATAALALYHNDQLLVAGLGDTEAILGGPDRSSPIRVLTHRHDPADPIEQARIEQSGGEVKVFPDECTAEETGPARVFIAGEWTPGLAVARAFGDFMGKKVGISAVPDVRTANTATQGQVLIMASDGVWDVLDPAVAMELCLVFAKRRDAEVGPPSLLSLYLSLGLSSSRA